jgi:hypothetical protein
MSGRSGAAIDSSCRSAIMNLMEDQQAPQSAGGEAKVTLVCAAYAFCTLQRLHPKAPAPA